MNLKYVNDVVAGEVVRLGTEIILVHTVNDHLTIVQGPVRPSGAWMNTPMAHWHAYDIITGGSRNQVLTPWTQVEVLYYIAPEVIHKLKGRCYLEGLIADRLLGVEL